jgi:cathepsin B
MFYIIIMKFVICLLLVLSVALARHPVNQEIVDEIKRSTSLWWPSEVEDNIFKYKTEESIVSMMGTQIDLERDAMQAQDLGIMDLLEGADEAVPAEFDSRTAWTMCPFDIKDQGHCGSCWAFGAVEAFEDRLCIKSEGEFTTDLSEQVVVSCDYVGFGCNGGFPLSAYGYLTLFGTTTEECVPYQSGETGKTGGCSGKCADSSVSNKRYRCSYPWINYSNNGIKKEIAKNGPVETAFSVYEDFMNYQGGIYHHTTGGYLGGHAVKIVGWGAEEGVKYWLAANSWSTNWGEQGYFRIKEGECGFASAGYSCAV